MIISTILSKYYESIPTKLTVFTTNIANSFNFSFQSQNFALNQP